MEQKEISDDAETIRKASEASGSGKDLAQKMRNGQAKPQRIEDFYVKTSSEIPNTINKIVDVLLLYAEKVKQKKMYYGPHDQKWFAFGEEDKDKEIGEIERIVRTIHRITDRPPKDAITFNEHVKFVWRPMIMGGIEG
jgi:ribosome-binding protein aMBF1 (putative translation factor)